MIERMPSTEVTPARVTAMTQGSSGLCIPVYGVLRSGKVSTSDGGAMSRRPERQPATRALNRKPNSRDKRAKTRCRGGYWFPGQESRSLG